MARRFTRQQLIGSLLEEVSKAQASFQAAQLDAWRQLAPEAAQPGAQALFAVNEIELQLSIKPYTAPWPIRLYRWLRSEIETGEPTYLLAGSRDPMAISLRLRVDKNGNGYRLETNEAMEAAE